MNQRRLPVGAEVLAGGGAHFRVWAPGHQVEVLVDGAAVALEPEAGGYHAGAVGLAGPGSLYRYRLDRRGTFPDPASRSQPEGPHGPSRIVDPGAYAWESNDWRGPEHGLKGQVIYELHVGTFTREGTFAAAIAELPRLRRTGITLIELLPVAEFAGDFGWGYDGVDLFAPSHLYGTPDDLRRFVDCAHAAGLGVLLDVVYNHVGPDGAYLAEFSKGYFSRADPTEWGEAINFDGEHSAPVREFFAANAAYWIDEFRFDGLRLDATQSIRDTSPRHILAEIAERARGAAAGRGVVMVAENEPQHARLVRPAEEGGHGLDGMWNDDYHHAAIAAATGRAEAYYSDTPGSAQELVSAVKWGFLFQGQRYAWQKQARGAPALDVPSPSLVVYLENHDQVANTLRGARLAQRTSPAVHRALVALLLLGPQTPMLFQGEEFGSTAPFLYFADHKASLARQVKKGRADFLAQFPPIASEASRAVLDDPAAPSTFTRCKLDAKEGKPQVTALYRDLLALRREDPAFAQQRGDRIHGTILGERAFALRFLCPAGDRLVLVNLGRTLRFRSIADPLVAPPSGAHWKTIWSSEDVRYGGDGVGPIDEPDGWRVGGGETAVLAPANAGTRGEP